MKRTFIAIVMAVASISLYAQQPQQKADEKTPEQKAEIKAAKMASDIMLSDAESAKFIPVYKAYLLELKAINEKYRPAKRGEEMKGVPPTDREVKARIEANFEKSQKILDLRKAYYQKYLNLITPKQIMTIYKIERMDAGKAQLHKGHKGPKGPKPGAGRM